MVPVGTPPNAIAYASGYVRIKHMIKAGAIIALLGVGILSLMAWMYW